MRLAPAIETGDPIGKVLAAWLQENGSPDRAEKLMQLWEREGNQESVPLSELAFVATRKCWELKSARWSNPSPEDRVELAHLVNRLGRKVDRNLWAASRPVNVKRQAES